MTVSIYCRNCPEVVAVRYLPKLKIRLCARCLEALEPEPEPELQPALLA